MFIKARPPELLPLSDCVPCAERVRFLKTGGEAIAACIRLARYRTGRDHVVQIGYNGWLNSLATGSRVLPGMIAESTPPGVPSSLCSLHHAVEWHDIESIEKWFSEFGDKIAAFVVAAHYAKMAQGKTFYETWLRRKQEYQARIKSQDVTQTLRLQPTC